ncbi:hypothetical protein LCGC14_2763900 [marine sediment metagenome]|uniref:Uncharacterized protein n=1 Tax=marine sediment metagenome TaxID=412755 RepID=A0A0F8ZK46_9ZZZZ
MPEPTKGKPESALKTPWPDDTAKDWPKCPSCGHEGNFLRDAVEGEQAKIQQNARYVPQMMEMRYESGLLQKVLRIAVDVCIKCGTVFAMKATKLVIKPQILSGPAPQGRPQPVTPAQYRDALKGR